MRRTRLRSNRTAAREWQERSRAAALEREQDAPPAPSSSRAIDRVVFRPALPASSFPCARCARLLPLPDVPRAVQWHHWLEQQHLKTYVLTLRIRDEREEALTFKRLINDERNTSPVCLDCHGITGTQHAAKFDFEDVPPSAFAFAYELGNEWGERLRRTYTERAA